MEGALVAVMAKVEGVVIKNFSGGFASRPPQILYYFLAPPIQKVLRRSLVRCLNKSSSFYNAGSNSSKGLTRKSKNRIKENSGIPDSK